MGWCSTNSAERQNTSRVFQIILKEHVYQISPFACEKKLMLKLVGHNQVIDDDLHQHSAPQHPFYNMPGCGG